MFIVWKRKNVAILLFIALAIQLALIFCACISQLSQKTSLVDYTVVIDAGHGGKDAGVTAQDGTKESDLNLAYAKTLGQMFANSGFHVVYTRKTEGGLYGLPTKGFKMRDMQARKRIIDNANPNIVVSIHMNEYKGQLSRKGPQVFYQTDSAEGQKLAYNLQRAFNSFTGNSHDCIDGDFYVCREVAYPSVIVECGFLSNAEELKLLQTESYRSDLCHAIFNGVMMYLCG